MAKSQSVPLGFYEGLMGNSGAAISESTASSFYNPSLILFKLKNSYGVGGNTFSNIKSDSEDSKLLSSKITPSYLSSAQVFSSFAHEFFLANISSIDSQTDEVLSAGGETKVKTRLENYQAGYTFAFHALPFGFQTVLRFSENQTTTFHEFQDSALAETSNSDGHRRQIDLVLGIGGMHQFDNYRLGYKYSSRGFVIYKKTKAPQNHIGIYPYLISTQKISQNLF